MVLSILFISLLAVLGPADVRAEVGCIDLEQCVNHESDITAFILQDYRGGQNVGGKLFVGGNADLKNSTIGNALSQSNGNEDHLVAGGDVSFFSGLMEKGNLVHGGKVLLASQVAESMGYNGVQKNNDRFDFARAGACFADKCGELKKMVPTANSTSEKSLNLVGHSDGVNVFDVSCHDIQEVTTISIKTPRDSTVMVRVGPSEHCDISGKNIHVTDSATLLWNFCDTSKVFVEDMDFKGTLFAPAAEVFAERASFANQVFAGNWHGDAEMSHRPFKGCSAADSEITDVTALVQIEEVVSSRDVMENLLFDDQQLFLEASTGDLFLEVATGDLFLEAATGDLFLEAATGDLFLEAATGDLFLEAATGDLFLEAATGDLFLEVSTGDLFLEVSTGDLFLEEDAAADTLFLEASTGDLFLETGSGDLFLEEDLVDDYPSAPIMLETSTGELFLETDTSSHDFPNLFLEASTGARGSCTSAASPFGQLSNMLSLHSTLADLPKKEQVCQFSALGADPRQDKKAVESPRSRTTTAGNSPATFTGSGDDLDAATGSPLTASSPVYLTRRTGSEDENGGLWGFLQTVPDLPEIPAPPHSLIGDAEETAAPKVLEEELTNSSPSRSTSACSSLLAGAVADSADAPPFGSPMYLKRERVDGSPEHKQDALTPCFDGNVFSPAKQINIEDRIFGTDALIQEQILWRPELDGMLKNPAGIIGERINSVPEFRMEQHVTSEAGGDVLWSAIEHYLGVEKSGEAEAPQPITLGTTPCSAYPSLPTPVLRLSDALAGSGATPVSSIGVSCQPNQPQILSTSLGSDTAPSPTSVLRLADALPEPTIGSPEMPTAGSAGHRFGTCKPCAFMHTKGCGNGVQCSFCHICGPDELRRRKKERVSLRQNVLRLTKVLP